MLLLLTACGIPRSSTPCACDGGMGLQIQSEGGCVCVPHAEMTADPQAQTLSIAEGETVDWAAVNASLSEGHVRLSFAGSHPRITIDRTDASAHRLILDGGGGASAEGIYSGARGADNVTVRGFEITNSSDKGVAWTAGSGVLIEDNLIHDNAGSPAVYLDYSSRSGVRSTGFSVRNNHIHSQRGECIYIGGSEGEDADSHSGVAVERNLVHDCFHRLTDKTDGINIKDRITDLVVRGNVVVSTDWGIELASPGEVSGNLVLHSRSNGFHITDEWGLGLSGLVMTDNAVLGAGEAGVYLSAASHPWQDVTVDGLTVIAPAEAGVELGGAGGISGVWSRVLVAAADVGLDAWSPMAVTIDCATSDVGTDTDRELAGLSCAAGPDGLDVLDPAGPDGWLLTEDDPWRSALGALP